MKSPPTDTMTSQPEPQRWRGLVGGGVLAAASLVFLIGGVQLGLGSPFRLGTGAFPFLTGAILLGLSVAIGLREWRQEAPDARIDWINFGAITAALAVFAATADRLGLMPAVFLTILVASAPDRSLPLWGKAALGASVSLVAWLVFIEALNLPLKAFAGS